jgi:RNA polymerase sigma-70 factor, ECF subfamily
MSEENTIEAKLLSRICLGDEQAFKEFFNSFAESLLNFAFRFVKDRQIAEDIVQGVLVKIWINRENLKPISSIKSYLFCAVRNGAFQYLKHEKVKQNNEEIIKSLHSINQTPEQEIQEKELSNIIKKTVEELPDKCQNIFKMNRYDGLSYSEIAELENISINTVKTQMGRAFIFLRKRLTPLLTSIIM